MKNGPWYGEPLIGLTLPEHGLGRKAVHLLAPAFVLLASSGSGKLLTFLSHLLIGLAWDLLVISPKPDLPDFGIGRRGDPRLFDDAELVRHWGSRLGVKTSEISAVTRFVENGRVMNIDAGHQTAFPPQRYTFLSDIDPLSPNAVSRLTALAEAMAPEGEGAREPFWVEAAQGMISGAIGHVLTTETDKRRHNLVYVAQRILGIDPATGKSDPKASMAFFRAMAANPALGGHIAAQGSILMGLNERTLTPLLKTVENALRWILGDPRMRDILQGPSDFSLEELGRGPHPFSVFATPVRGDKSTGRFLACLLALALLVFQQRESAPKRKVALVCDEVPNWSDAALIKKLAQSVNILRDVQTVPFIVGQSAAQFIRLLGREGFDELLSASVLTAFGVRDKTTLEYLRDKLGRTTIRRNGRREEVYLADTDAIAAELAPSSPLQYVFPYETGSAMRLGRAACVDVVTSEGLHAPALNYEGCFDHGLPRYTSRRR
jgi:hypothetical protein